MENSNKQGGGKQSQSNEKATEGRDTGLGRDPKREKLPINDEQEILKSQKGKQPVDANPYDKESDKPAE
jgi:hypothetical protein